MDIFKNIEIRQIPNPPSFNKIPAKIIEPITGASTWAFGSHKWNINMGNLIKNPNINRIDIKVVNWLFQIIK